MKGFGVYRVQGIYLGFSSRVQDYSLGFRVQKLVFRVYRVYWVDRVYEVCRGLGRYHIEGSGCCGFRVYRCRGFGV